jgi:hypothetical protein
MGRIIEGILSKETYNPAPGLTDGTVNGSPFRTTNLPTVSDPEKTYADITRSQYEDFINKFGGYEKALVQKGLTDTTLVDEAKVDSRKASEIASGIQQRNIDRYGVGVDPATRREQLRANMREGELGYTGSVNDARLAQEDANTNLLYGLMNIGNGVYSGAMSQLGSSAQNAAQLQNAYRQAKANSKASTMSTIGQLGSLAMLAMSI